jgi:hypothetical protein
MSRATSAEGVLESIYSVAGVPPPLETADSIFRGHPLAVAPRGAASIFYILWPGLFLSGALLIRRSL